MLVIRSEQMRALSARAEEGYVRRITAHLHAHWPAAARAQGSALQPLIHEAISRARSHGLASEYDVARFIDVMFALALDFDTSRDHAWAQRILIDPTLDASARMDRICARAFAPGNVPPGER